MLLSGLSKRGDNVTMSSPVLIIMFVFVNRLNAELNPICHLLALLGAHHILHVGGIRVNVLFNINLYGNLQL
jgi:hypothetical protein